MGRKRQTQTTEQSEPIASAVDAVVQQAQERQPGEDEPRKKWTPPKDPFGFENKLGAEGNRVHLFKSEHHGAWVIRFDKPPNEMEGYSKENPHPVLKMLKEEGFRWGFDEKDGIGGHGKRFTGDPYGADHIEARRVLAKAQEMIGGEVEQVPFR